MLAVFPATFFAARHDPSGSQLVSGTLLATVAAQMRARPTVIFFAALAVVGACSTTTMEGGCYSDNDCETGYLCDDSSGACYLGTDGNDVTCSKPSDCLASYTCGQDGHCAPGDCYFNGCVTGFDCQSSTGTWQCLPNSAGAGGASGDSEMTLGGSGGIAEAAGQRG